MKAPTTGLSRDAWRMTTMAGVVVGAAYVLSPLAFAYTLMTRSKKIDREKLRQRVAGRAMWIVAALASALLGGLLVPLFLPAKQDPNASSAEAPAHPKKVMAYQGEIKGVDKDKLPFSIKAEKGTQDSLSSDVVQLETVAGTFARNDGKNLDVVSNAGQYNTKSKVLNLDGAVVIRDNKGMTARMDKAVFDTATKSLVSQTPVDVTLTNGTIAADTLTTDNNGERMLFKGRVKAVFGTPQK